MLCEKCNIKCRTKKDVLAGCGVCPREPLLKEQKDPRIMGDDHYDKIEYFKKNWKRWRSGFLKQAQPVHKNMEAVAGVMAG